MPVAGQEYRQGNQIRLGDFWEEERVSHKQDTEEAR